MSVNSSTLLSEVCKQSLESLGLEQPSEDVWGASSGSYI